MKISQEHADRFAKVVTVSSLFPTKENYAKQYEDLMQNPGHPDFDKEAERLLALKYRKELDESNEKLLRKVSKQVNIDNEEEIKKCREIIKKLEEVLVVSYREDGRPKDVIGYGLSAIQLIEIASQEWVPRVCIVRIPWAKNDKPLILNMINPQIIRGMHSYKHDSEGCMSFPGNYLSTKRFYGVRLGFIDADDLKPREMELYGIEAVCVQHEVDHQDGLLFKDKHNFPMTVPKTVGPNDPCPCGKKKENGEPIKRKKCCG